MRMGSSSPACRWETRRAWRRKTPMHQCDARPSLLESTAQQTSSPHESICGIQQLPVRPNAKGAFSACVPAKSIKLIPFRHLEDNSSETRSSSPLPARGMHGPHPPPSCLLILLPTDPRSEARAGPQQPVTATTPSGHRTTVSSFPASPACAIPGSSARRPYSPPLESRLKVTGPSFSSDTFIIAPNTPSLMRSGKCALRSRSMKPA